MKVVREDEPVPIALPSKLARAPQGWRWEVLKHVARLESGHTPSRSRPEWWGGDISWVSLTEIRALDGRWVEDTEIKTNPAGVANSAARVLPRGTVCFSRTASVGFVTIMAKPMATSQDFANWVCGDELDPEFLMHALIRSRAELRALATGATHKTIYMPTLEAFQVCLPDRGTQMRIAARLKDQLAGVAAARRSAKAQVGEFANLTNAIVAESMTHPNTGARLLGDVLKEVKQGIGQGWADHPVLGATRDGLAPAKEPVGKNPERYKPVLAGTVFYNPMRILIGSIAMVDDDDTPGITSPDYVVLRGLDGVLDSRWFYYWLRSTHGEHVIASLARGAVRERMLFNRLAEGAIELPPYAVQLAASRVLAEVRPLKARIEAQLREIELLPARLLAEAFKFTEEVVHD
jgi:type I restriction enzyme, S subunit